MIHLYSGYGKGKTSSAVGLTIRALGAGNRVLFAQFLKYGNTSEIKFLESINEGLTLLYNAHPCKFFNAQTDLEKLVTIHDHDETLKKVVDAIENKIVDVIILDEITYVYNFKICSDVSIIDSIIEKCNKNNIELVMTGRDPSDNIINSADYWSSLEKHKHPFDYGMPAREGIEF